jgi:hypothetical protein
MGQSLAKLKIADVVANVKSIGAAYHQYETTIINHGIDGRTLSYMQEEEIADCFRAIGVTNKLHWIKLRLHFQDLALTLASSSGDNLSSAILGISGVNSSSDNSVMSTDIKYDGHCSTIVDMMNVHNSDKDQPIELCRVIGSAQQSSISDYDDSDQSTKVINI